TFVTTSDNPSVTWSVSTVATVQGNFIPGPRMIGYVQGVNQLYKKVPLVNTNRTASISFTPPISSGQQLFFTVFFPDGEPRPGQPFSIGTPHVGAATASFNAVFPDPRLDNNWPNQVDPMSGGFHRWFYGDWNGDRTFDEGQIRVVSNPQNTDTFMFASPAPAGLTSRPDLGPIQL